MKRILSHTFKLLLLALIFVNCNKEPSDITIEITGNYLGNFSSNANGSESSIEITVTKVNETRVNIQPASDNLFEAFETDIIKSDNNYIYSPTEDALETNVLFVIGTFETVINLQRIPSGNVNNAFAFVGEKQ